MSGQGQTETNRHVQVTSGFTPITDINLARCQGRLSRRLNRTPRTFTYRDGKMVSPFHGQSVLSAEHSVMLSSRQQDQWFN